MATGCGDRRATNESTGATVELVVVDWLREVCGLAPTTQGLFVSRGSDANCLLVRDGGALERPSGTTRHLRDAESRARILAAIMVRAQNTAAR